MFIKQLCFLSNPKAVKCSQLRAPANGKVNHHQLNYMANATISCDEGYNYSNPESKVRTCQGDNTWSGQEGKCEGMYLGFHKSPFPYFRLV